MKHKKLLKKTSRALKFWGKSKTREERLKPVEKKEGFKPWIFAYNLVGGKVDGLLSLSIMKGVFGSLKKTLMQSRLRISLKAYVSLIILSSTIVFLASIFTSTVVFFQFLKMNFLMAFLSGIGTSLATVAVTFLIFYLYPRQAASSLKTKIESNMPFATSFMAVLSSAGVAPSKMFRALTVADGMDGISDEARIIVRNIDVFGQDLLTGVENVSRETVSKKLSNILEGYVTTIRTGGDIQGYLTIQAKQSIDDKRLSVKRFIDSLTMISEMYVTTIIVVPIMSAMLLSVMSLLSGVLSLNPLTMIYIMAFLFIPFANILLVLFIEMLSPQLKG